VGGFVSRKNDAGDDGSAQMPSIRRRLGEQVKADPDRALLIGPGMEGKRQ
jgi:hypothetical protein